jgi:hypothetical protein
MYGASTEMRPQPAGACGPSVSRTWTLLARNQACLPLPSPYRSGTPMALGTTRRGRTVRLSLTGQGPLRGVPDATRRQVEELTLSFIEKGLA